MQKINIKSTDKMLIVAPHPDDECIGCGGILAIYPKQCDILVMTDGSMGNNKYTRLKEKEIRKNDFLCAMEYLNISSYIWLGLQDRRLFFYIDCLSNIDFSKYTIIFLPYVDDVHIDHTATFAFAAKKIRRQNLHNVTIFQYEVHVPFQCPTHYLNITDVIEKKIKAINCHEDQMNQLQYGAIAQALNKYRACRSNFSDEYWEAYTLTDVFNDNYNKVIIRENIICNYENKYNLISNWLYTIDNGESISKYLIKLNYKNVCIYGYDVLGKMLYHELKNSIINIYGIMDQNANNIVSNQKINLPTDDFNNADAVIVTTIKSHEKILKLLTNFGYKNILFLVDIVEVLFFKCKNYKILED